MMPHTIKHSVIIPAHNRDEHLDICLRSLAGSGGDRSDWEVIVVGNANIRGGSFAAIPLTYLAQETSPPFLRLRPGEPRPFWKNRLLNVGIDAAKGNYLTFLDADAVVGPDFLKQWHAIEEHGLTRLCYRVRKLAAGTTWGDAKNAWRSFNFTLANGSPRFSVAYEAYGDLTSGVVRKHLSPVLGNSQFTIARKTLDDLDLRFDENYYGRGFEDLSMIRDILERSGSNYKAEIVTSGRGAMFHIQHPLSPGFDNDRWYWRNLHRYRKTRCLWVLSDSRKTLDNFKRLLVGWFNHDDAVKVIYRTEDAFDVQETNPEYDRIVRIGSKDVNRNFIQEMIQ